jgi:hypothetical protein
VGLPSSGGSVSRCSYLRFVRPWLTCSAVPRAGLRAKRGLSFGALRSFSFPTGSADLGRRWLPQYFLARVPLWLFSGSGKKVLLATNFPIPEIWSVCSVDGGDNLCCRVKGKVKTLSSFLLPDGRSGLLPLLPHGNGEAFCFGRGSLWVNSMGPRKVVSSAFGIEPQRPPGRSLRMAACWSVRLVGVRGAWSV